MEEFLKQQKQEAQIINSSEYEIDITETSFVPDFSDSLITFDNLDKKTKKCKSIYTCVLYVDMRNSTSISVEKQPKTLVKIYSSFIKSMIAAANYYGGKIRNIIGDRLMVVFDSQDCFTNSVNTAILMNTLAHNILNKVIKSVEFSCGIGIDYGRMLITKAGAIRRGSETEFYRSLVWLGKPANIASKLTDIANKNLKYYKNGVRQGLYYRFIDDWLWQDVTFENFLNDLEVTYSRNLKHKNENFCSFYQNPLGPYGNKYKPILVTEDVFNGFKKENPKADSIKNDWWNTTSANIDGYSGKIYESNIYKAIVDNI